MQDYSFEEWAQFDDILLNLGLWKEFSLCIVRYTSLYIQKYVENLKLIKELNAITTKIGKCRLESIEKSQQGYVFESLCYPWMQHNGQLRL